MKKQELIRRLSKLPTSSAKQRRSQFLNFQSLCSYLFIFIEELIQYKEDHIKK